jgi:FMN-dependent NADH-azoreductase
MPMKSALLTFATLLCLFVCSNARAQSEGKKAILVLASGGVFTEGPWQSWDFVEPYLRKILSFIGIESVQTVRAEGMNIPPLADSAVPNAEKTVESLAL